MFVHKDERRSMYEYRAPITKILVVHSECVLGNHYHKEREETFVLLAGEGIANIGPKNFPMKLHEPIEVERGVMHSFQMGKGSVLLELASKEFDKTDDYKI